MGDAGRDNPFHSHIAIQAGDPISESLQRANQVIETAHRAYWFTPRNVRH